MLPEQLVEISDFLPDSPLTKLEDPWLDQFNVNVFIKRDDLIHPLISGNKFRKLKYALRRYEQEQFQGIVSFGGLWSNHLHALSCVAEKYKIPSIALIRGHRPTKSVDTLIDIERSGMEIHFITREDYRELRRFREQGRLREHPILKPWDKYLIVPEGGSSTDALLGVADILTETRQQFDRIYLACGTGATVAGLSVGLKNLAHTRLTGIAALKAGTSLQENVQHLLNEHYNLMTSQANHLSGNQSLDNKARHYSDNWQIDLNYHFGGFAKISDALLIFMKQLYQRTGLVTEPVYTGKCLYALYDHIKSGVVTPGEKIMMIHTGGLQGLRGYRGKGIEPLLSAAGFE